MNTLAIAGLYFHIGAVMDLPEEKVKLVGVADRKYEPDSLFFNPGVDPEVFANERNVPLYDNYRTMLDELNPDIVAVYCVDSEKTDVILEALGRGKHVVVDKPLCTTLGQFDRIEKAVAASSGTLALLLPFPYHPVLLKIREMIADRKIGDILSVRSRRAYIQKIANRPKWFFTKQYGGGLLCDIGTHEYDLIRFLTNREAVEVTAYARNGKIRQFETGEDYAHALFRMTDGVIYSLHLDRISALNSVGDQSSLEIIGAKGQIVVPIGYERIVLTVEGEDAPRIYAEFPQIDIYQGLMQDYMRGLETGDYAAPCFAPRVLKSVRAVLSAQQSADNDGRKIVID